jgi:shikimate kinase
MKLWLVGMMGVGKSEVGQLVANRLNLGFVDSDATISEREGRTIPEIWAGNGEERFRDLEAEVIAQVAGSERSQVIATGGGSVLRRTNRAAMQASGRVVWLTAPPSVLASRLADSLDRPLLTGAGTLEERINELLEQRWSVYENLADGVVDATSADSVTVAHLVEQLWNHFQLA